jgi:predicted dehydrogenase
MDRRLFIHAAAGGLGYFYAAPAYSADKVRGANDRIRLAGIGVGGKGRSDIEQAGAVGQEINKATKEVIKSAITEVIALVDIDESKGHLGGAAEKFRQAKTFFDYRKLIDSPLFKDVDAVTISTPDHHHAAAAAPCIRAKKHVYVQKPLTRTVFEADLLRKLAAEHKVCTQMGNQGTTENGLRRAVELVQGGALGDVSEVHVWTNRPVWPQAPGVMGRPPESPVPAHVHWEEFIGPAPMRPYAVYSDGRQRKYGNGAYHSFNWRGWWDFGTGAIGDMACHTANMAFMALKLGWPTKVTAEAGDVNNETCPSWAHVTLEFPARDGLKPVTLHWYEGARAGYKVTPPYELVTKALACDPDPKRNKGLVNSGSILVGSKGILYSPNDYGAQVYGSKELGDALDGKKPEKLPVNGRGDQGQKDEWVEAIRANDPKKALSNFDYASLLTAAFLLGNVAIRTGKGFEFDPETLTCKGCPEGQQYIKGEYRKGWDLVTG